MRFEAACSQCLWPIVPLKRMARIGPGEGRPDGDNQGDVPLLGANGPIGTVGRGNLDLPAVIVGRVGSAGAVNVTSPPVWISDNALVVLPNPDMELRYLSYVMPLLDLGEDAAQTAQPLIIQTQVAERNVPCPPLAIQRVISDYLDRETARIDALIAAKRQMTELLNERLTSLRDHAFASKPGWRLKRLLADPMAYGVLVPEFVEGGTGVPMVRTYNLSTKGRIDHGDIAEIPEALAREYRRTSLHQGDVILSVVGSMGRSAVVGPDEQGFNLNRPLARLRLRPEIPPRLLWHWTQTTHFMDLAKLATGGGTAQPTLNLGDLASFTIGLPQGAELWPGILSNLEEVYEQINDTEQLVSRQIALLLERRQALITAAVTGQFDIPEAA